MEKIVKFGAVNEYGCDFISENKEEVQKFIDNEVAGTGATGAKVAKDYYSVAVVPIYGYTQKELDEMVEDKGVKMNNEQMQERIQELEEQLETAREIIDEQKSAIDDIELIIMSLTRVKKWEI